MSSCVCPSVRPSVKDCHSRHVPKWLNAGSRKQRHTIAQGLCDVKDFGEIPTGSPPPPTGTPNRCGVDSNRRLLHQYLAIGLSQKRCKIATQLLWHAARTLIGTRLRFIEWCYFSNLEWRFLLPQTTLFSIFCIALYIFVVGGDKEFKFGN